MYEKTQKILPEEKLQAKKNTVQGRAVPVPFYIIFLPPGLVCLPWDYEFVKYWEK